MIVSDRIVVDKEGFRSNVGLVVADGRGLLLWTKRVGQDAWQFPQGGINRGESPEEAAFRELYEETGLQKGDVRIIARTRGWLRYRLPKRYVRRNSQPLCIGQKQKWFLMQLLCSEDRICFDAGPKPEFDAWQWVSYWYPVGQVVDFKREVYRQALRELAYTHVELERSRPPGGGTHRA